MSLLRAPAKLTWYLEVTGRRTNGMHEITSEMTTIDLVDLVEVEADGDSLRVEGPCAASVPIDATNIVARALALVGRRCSVVVHKEIPVGGGLGGGSADAGAILRWAGGVTNDEALLLGGDVPFCQLGGRALVEGVGERVTPLALRAISFRLSVACATVATIAMSACAKPISMPPPKTSAPWLKFRAARPMLSSFPCAARLFRWSRCRC